MSKTMRKTGWLVLLMAVSCGAWAQSRNEVEGKLIALENTWNNAQKDRDMAALDAVVADGFVHTDSNGVFRNKAEYLSAVKDPSIKITSMVNDNVHVFVYGTSAIVVGSYTAKGTNKGKAFEYKGRFTNTWVQTDGKWECVASSSQHLQKS